MSNVSPEKGHSEYEIAHMLVISTAHLKKESMQAIEDDAFDYPCLKREQSVMLWVPSNSDDHTTAMRWLDTAGKVAGVPLGDVKHVVTFAHHLGCQWVHLDLDGDEIDDLPTYEWR